MKELSVLLVGVGGYGVTYVQELAAHAREYNVKVVGAVDPFAEKSAAYALLQSLTNRIYPSLEAFFSENRADIAVISTPLPYHHDQAVFCMEHGAHVLVEKPVACTMSDAEDMVRVRDRTGRILAVGFQWCYDRAMLALRRDVRTGLFGQPISMRALVLWPRDSAYYSRSWSGKKYDAQGRPIFDSVAGNGTAHYLQNMLWLAGEPLSGIEAFTARANPIETYDTIVLKGKLGTADMTYVASHCAGRAHLQDPMFEYVFEKGTVCFGGFSVAGQFDPIYGKTTGHTTANSAEGLPLTVRMNDGTINEYGPTYTGGQGNSKLLSVIQAARGMSAELCSAEDAMLLTRALEPADRQESYVFPEGSILNDNGTLWVPGLAETLISCYAQRSLPVLPSGRHI